MNPVEARGQAWRGDGPRDAALPRAFRVGILDSPDAGAGGGDEGVVEWDAWVSLGHPRGLAGELLDEASYEGAWMEDGGTCCFRVGGVTSRAVVPAVGSQDEARGWLAGRLAALRDGASAEVAAGGGAMAA